MGKIRAACSSCAREHDVEIDASTAQDVMTSFKNALDDEGFFRVACENCYPKSAMGIALKEWEERKALSVSGVMVTPEYEEIVERSIR